MARRYISNRDESVRIFASDRLERFTYVHPIVPHLVFWPVVAVCLVLALGRGASGSEVAAAGLIGAALWTLTEYVIHRFVLHTSERVEDRVRDVVRALPSGTPVLSALRGWREKFYFLAHGVHHDFPNDSRRLVLPPGASIPLAIAFYGLFALVAGSAMGPAAFAGFVTGYIVYDTIHFAVHHFRPRTAIGRYLKKLHYRHHYDDARKDFGVSTPVWDVAFGTHTPAGRRPRA